jgi:hypothetical protein
MDRTTATNHAVVGGKRKFTDGPPATTIPADFLNALQEEIVQTLEYAGIAPNAAYTTQLRYAIVYLIRNAGVFTVDIGAANAYAINPVPALSVYQPGMVIWFQAAHANTGASTININGLGVKSIKKNGTSTLVAGDILANQVVSIVYDGVNFQVAAINASQSCKPSFRAHATTNPSITGGSVTVLPYSVEDEDTTAAYDTGTYRFMPQVAGWYFVGANIKITPGIDQGYSLYIYKNGIYVIDSVYHTAGSPGNPTDISMQVSDLVYLNGSIDYVDIRMLVTSTETIGLNASSFFAFLY